MDDKKYQEILKTLEAARSSLIMSQYQIRASMFTLDTIKRIEKLLKELKNDTN